ncbi:hypothetical protein ABPS01_00840 [Streptococcus sp. ZJ151]|uniref:hypothetical protein n=1 Tax=Streptococcus jiangjianxini TaxID=3161189 RepID=UPI0032ECC7C9
MIIHKIDELALAIVSSSSPDLSIDDKIKLFIESRQAIEEYNRPLIEAKREVDKAKSRTSHDAISKYFGR